LFEKLTHLIELAPSKKEPFLPWLLPFGTSFPLRSDPLLLFWPLERPENIVVSTSLEFQLGCGTLEMDNGEKNTWPSPYADFAPSLPILIIYLGLIFQHPQLGTCL
uniref:Uncharacterized protein n=1 Tax=Laticauda laticaudata TaxID=8630 RepID=A0A8C5S6G9_LATLA